jgi:hypothetical protein
MKNLLVTLLLVPLAAFANTNAETTGAERADRTVNTPIPAGSTVVLRHQLGSGTPGFTGFEPATHMGEGIYHAPQYMPSYPTAAALWPRVVEVECERTPNGAFSCNGYDWLPALGRGEYLYIRPMVKVVAPPVVVEKIVRVPVPTPVIVERKVFIEVPVKKKGE